MELFLSPASNINVACIEIAVADDNITEGAESVVLTLEASAFSSESFDVAPNQATLTIQDQNG